MNEEMYLALLPCLAAQGNLIRALTHEVGLLTANLVQLKAKLEVEEE